MKKTTDEEHWMEICDRRRIALIHEDAPLRLIEDAEEEYEEARRMYRLSLKKNLKGV